MPLELLKSKTGRTLIESHRGVEADVPENSWSAIQLGHQLGADLLEVDVQLSQDGVAFLHHNYQLLDGRWCHEVSLNELQELKITGESLPKLEEVLAWAKDVNQHLSLDMKTFFRAEGSLVKEVIRLLERTNTKHHVMLLFFDHHELFQTKLAYPEITVRALLTGRPMDYPQYLQKIKADNVNVAYGLFCPSDVEAIHAAGVSVTLGGLWNPNTDLFHSLDIDIFSHGNPIDARKILNGE